MKIYGIADTHFNHYRIIEYCNRPWKTVEEMNKQIIANWNETINDRDIVWVLGDFGFGSAESLECIASQLNGDKKLLMGNHDRKKSVTWWKNLGFSEVVNKPFTLFDNIIASHEPVDVAPDLINIHGHIHNTPLPTEFSPDNHMCISIEMIDYKPILLREF